MSAIGRAWRRLAHPFGAAEAAEADPRTAVLQAIARTRGQQARLAANAGSVFVRRAEVEQALERQHRDLADAAEQIRQSMAVAGAAAEGARAADEVDDSPYTLTARGLQTQLDVVEHAISHLDVLRADARANAQHAQALLRESAAVLDGALRAEVQLLGGLERLERARVIEQARRRARDGEAGPPGRDHHG